MSAMSHLHLTLTVAIDEMRESLSLQQDLQQDLREERLDASIEHSQSAIDNIECLLNGRRPRPERSLFSEDDFTSLKHVMHFIDATEARLRDVATWDSTQHEIWRSISASVAAMRALTASLLEEER